MAGLRELVRLPDVRRIEAAWGLSTVAWTSSTVAVLVYAYAAGGPTLVAVYSVARALWGAAVALVGSSLADRVRRDRLLRLTTATRAILVAVGAGTALVDGPSAVAVAAIVAADGLAGIFRPIQAAALPWLVRTPAELAVANVAATIMESTGALLGPVIAGVGLLVADAPTTLAMSAVWTLLALVPLLRLRLPDDSRDQTHGDRHMGRDFVAGGTALLRLRPAAGLFTLALVQTVARGVLMVALVVFAFDVLHLDDAALGWLNAAIGIGGLLGGVLGAVVVRSDRLGQVFVAGVAAWGVALLLMAQWPVAAVAFVAMLLIGVGNVFEDASMFTLIPRLVGAGLTGRVLGALELLIVIGIGVGSLIAPSLIELAGDRAGFGIIGGLVLVAALGYVVPFARVDRSLPAPRPEVELLRALPMFAPLPLVIVEQVSDALVRCDFPAGSVAVRQGAEGDRFHVVASGRADVQVDDVPRPSLGPGDCFGEIALLRHSSRTATVTAATDLTTYTLDRDVFLRAVTGNRVSSTAADELTRHRLTADAAPDR